MYQAVISSCRRPQHAQTRRQQPGAGSGVARVTRSYLTVGVDGRAQQLPGAPPAVHPEHPQDLQEAEAAQRRGQHIPLVPHGDHGHGGDEHEDV